MSDTDSMSRNPQGRPIRAEASEKQQKQQRILIVLVIVVVVGAVFILYRNGVIGGTSGQAPVEKYLNAIAAKDFDAYVSSMPPKIAQDYIDDRNELGISGEEYMKTLYSDYFNEFGGDMTVTLEFTGRSRLETLYIENFKLSYMQLYGEEISVSSSLEIDVTAHFSGSVSADDIKLECFVIKSGGKWYIVGCDYETVEIEG